MKTVTQDIAGILKEMKEELQLLLGDNFSKMVLFGSRARGDWEEESDTDIALIVKDVTNQTRNSIYEKVAEIELKYDFPVSLLIVPESSFNRLKERERRIALDIEKEGIEL
jgi:predicted nucleotidyltransferase